MACLRVALFAEGSLAPRSGASPDPFVQLWQQDLVRALGLRQVDRVFPINKKHLLAMDPRNPPMSGAGESLDALMARKLRADPFDVAVVAWDLFPPWGAVSPMACRWEETLDLYRFLGNSAHLPPPWRDWAAAKSAELRGRSRPNARAALPQLARYATLAVCMEPVFEAMLTVSESGVSRALGVSGKRVPGWPPGWARRGKQRPETELLQPAILAARNLRPPPAGLPPIRGDMRTAKHEWGAYLVSSLSADPEADTEMKAHPTARRLREVLGRS